MLANRMTSALSIYNIGEGLPFEEIISHQRTIIIPAYKHSQLPHSLRKLWMQDDGACSSSGDDSENTRRTVAKKKQSYRDSHV